MRSKEVEEAMGSSIPNCPFHDYDTISSCADCNALVLAKEVLRLEGELAEALRERDGWKEDAARHCRNEDFYRGLVCGIGEQFGEAAHISDDGSRQQDVLCLKVPELVRDTLTALASEKSKRVEAERVAGEARASWHDFKIRLVETYGGPSPYLDRVIQELDRALSQSPALAPAADAAPAEPKEEKL